MVLGLGFTAVSGDVGTGPILLPLLVASGGIICSILGTAFVEAPEGADTTRFNMHLTLVHLEAAGVMALAFGLASMLWPAEGLITSTNGSSFGTMLELQQ